MDAPILVDVEYDLKQGESHCRAELDPVRTNFRISLRCNCKSPMPRARLFLTTIRYCCATSGATPLVELFVWGPI